MKLEFSPQIFEKCSNTKFHQNRSSGSRVVACGSWPTFGIYQNGWIVLGESLYTVRVCCLLAEFRTWKLLNKQQSATN